MTRVKGIRQTITLQCLGEPPQVRVEAEVFGPLAVHRCYAGDGGPGWLKYAITHVPTGLAVIKALTKGNAVAVVRRLLRLPVPWPEITCGNVQGYARIILPVLGRARRRKRGKAR